MLETARRGTDVATALRSLTRDQKDTALRAIAAALRERSEDIVAANETDVVQLVIAQH